MKYLYIVQQALVWLITIYWLYQLIISICSFVKLKDKDLKEEKDHKFKLEITDYLSYTKEQLMEKENITSEIYDQVFDN